MYNYLMHLLTLSLLAVKVLISRGEAGISNDDDSTNLDAVGGDQDHWELNSIEVFVTCSLLRAMIEEGQRLGLLPT